MNEENEVELTADVKGHRTVIGKCHVSVNEDGSLSVQATITDPKIIKAMNRSIISFHPPEEEVPPLSIFDPDRNSIGRLPNEFDEHIARGPQWSKFGYINTWSDASRAVDKSDGNE